MGEDVIELFLKFNTDGLKKGSEEAKKATESMGDGVKRFGDTVRKSAGGDASKKIGDGFRGASTKIRQATKSMSDATNGFGRILRSTAKTIIGIGATYQILSKAINAYMAENQKLSQQMSSIWTAFGNLLGPIIERIVSIVTTAVSYLLSFMKLLGVTAKSASQLSKSAKGAGGAIQATVAGFDELNKLSDGGGGGGGGAGLNEIAELLKGQMWEQAGHEIAKKLNDMVAKLDFKGLGTKIGKGFGGALKVLATVLSDFKFSELGRKLGEGVASIIHEIDWQDVGAIIMAKLTWLWETLIGFLLALDYGNISNAISNIIQGALNYLATKIGSIDWKEVGAKITQAIKDMFNPENLDLSGILEAIKNLASTIGNAFLDLLTGILGGESGEEPPVVAWLRSIGDAVSELCGKVMDSFSPVIEWLKNAYDSTVKPVLDWLINTALPWVIDKITAVVKLVTDYWPVVSPILGAIGTTIAGFGIATKIGNLISVISGPLMGVLKPLFAFLAANPLVAIIGLIVSIIAYLVNLYQTNEEFRAKVDAAWTAVKNAIGTAVEWIKEKFQAFKDKIVEVKTSITEFKQKAAEAFENVKTKVSNMWEKIKQVFSFKWELPHIKLPHITVTWEPAGAVAQFFGVNELPHLGISWYRKGGIVDGATLIGAGEDGKEAIIPLDRNNEWINMVADGLIRRLDESQSKIGENLAALQSIADTVAFRIPAMAGGAVVPYSVAASTEGDSSSSDNSEVLKLMEGLYELMERFVTSMDEMQFVAQFDDLRAFAKRITKEQKRQSI